jgi:hypothetical protein
MGDGMTLMKDDRDLRGEKKFGGSTTSDRYQLDFSAE